MHAARLANLVLPLTLLIGCSGNETPPAAGDDRGAGDSSSAGDHVAGDPLGGDPLTGDSIAGDPSAGDALAGDIAGDAGGPSVPLPGFGSISGSCGLIDGEEIFSASPYLFRLAIDFGTDPYDAADYDQLSAGGQQIVDDDNAGGSSLESEIFAYEVLYRCELAALLKTETFILYEPTPGSITDMLVEIDGTKIGVSVTRAMSWPLTDPYSLQQATDLLENKLLDVQESSSRVLPADAWQKQILVVLAYGPSHADFVESAFAAIDGSIKADTILVVTVSDGDDAFIY